MSTRPGPTPPLIPVGCGLALLLGLGLGLSVGASRSISVSEVVKAFCLSAAQAALRQQGKPVPAAQLDRNCGCVGDRVARGSDVEDAHAACGLSGDSGAEAGHVSHTQAGPFAHR